MSEFEELRINVKVEDEKSAEKTRQIKDSFGKIGDVEHTQKFEKLARQFSLNEAQIKQLSESVGKSGGQFSTITGLFGRGGLAFLGIAAVIEGGKKINEAFISMAREQMEVAHAAERIGILTGAQLEKNLELLEQRGVDRQRGIAMFDRFAQQRLEFFRFNSEFRKEMMDDVAFEDAGELRKFFQGLTQDLNPTEFANRVIKEGQAIREAWEKRAEQGLAPQGRGAQEQARWLGRWFGLPDMMHVHQEFAQITKDEEEAFNRILASAQEYFEVTTRIRTNLEKIISSIVFRTLDDFHMGGILRGLNTWFAEAAEFTALSPEDQQTELAKRQLHHREWLAQQLKKLFGTEPGLAPGAPGNLAVPFMDLSGKLNENQEALLTEAKRLVENLQTLNAFLSDPTRKEFGPLFHNAPMGGAAGESDPMQIPGNIAQPGGGAAAESRSQPRGGVAGSVDEALKMLGLNEIKDKEVLKRYMQTGGRDVAGDNNAWCARFVNAINVNAGLPGNDSWAAKSFMEKGWGVKVDPTQEPVQAGDIFTKTRKGGGHVGAATGNTRISPTTGETEYEMLSGNIGGEGIIPGTDKPAGGGGVGLTWETLSGKTSSGAAGGGSGGIIDVRRASRWSDPNYTGPEEGAGKGKRLDQSPAATAIAQRFSGDSSTDWAAGIPIRDLPESRRSENIEDRRADPAFAKGPYKSHPGVEEFFQRGFKSVEPSFGTDWDKSMADNEDSDRSVLDKAIGDELNVKGKLNVDVNAPSGTEVKADGEGMFEKNVSVNRSVGEPLVM